MANLMTRRAALAAIGAAAAGSVFGFGYLLRNIFDNPEPGSRAAPGPGGGMMGLDPVDRRTYMEMFRRHNEIVRSVEEIPGGVRTITQSDSTDLAAQLQAHVSRMYDRIGEGSEVTCMSSSLPTLFRNADGYRRRLIMTSTGVVAEETADDPVIVQAIRDHAREVTGFVVDGMPAMMGPMMGHGRMMRPH